MREFAPKPLQHKEEEEEEDKETEVQIPDKLIPLTKEQQKLVEQGLKQAEIIAKIEFKKIKNKDGGQILSLKILFVGGKMDLLVRL